MSKPLPAELLLAAACCRWPLGPAHRARVADLARQVADWDRFAGIVRRNRIAPIVHHALEASGVALPDAISAVIAERAVAAGWQSVGMAAESLRLQQAFDAAGMPALILKGVPLAMLAYGRLGLKEARDIDLLVRRQDVAPAVALLEERGYACRIEGTGPRRLEPYLTLAKEVEFVDPASGIMVELHWHLIDGKSILPGVGADGPAQPVAIAGGALRTLADRELFGYLCAHGTAHNWSRLKWLADLAALLASRDEAQIAELYRATEAQGTRRAADVALMLCEGLLGLELESGLSRVVRADPIARALCRSAIAGLDYRGGASESEVYSSQWLRFMASRFLLVRGPGHALGLLWTMWNSPLDRVAYPLPRGLSWLYHPMRIPLWLVRHGRRLAARGRA